MSSVAPPRRSTAFLLVFALAVTGGVIGYLPLLTLLLPLKIEALDGAARIGIFTATVVAGGVASSVANILFGWLSDRSLARGGGRRRWMAAGVAGTIVAYAGIAAARSPAEIVGAIVVFQVAVNALLAPLFAIMAEEIPDAQKGVASGLLALANPAASTLSAVLVGLSAMGEGTRLAVLAMVMTAFVAPLLITRGQRIASTPSDTPAAVSGRDLVIAGVARLLMQVTNAVALAYLLYYFETIVPDHRGLAAAVATLMACAFVLALPIAVLLGQLSDTVGRRKPFLLGAAIVSAAGLAAMAVAGSWTGGAIAFCAYTAGSAVFAALHSGFAMQLLPRPAHRGRDLGLLNLANTLPSLLGPPLTWMLATPQDFGGVMLMLAVLSLGSGGCILLVASRR